MDFWDRVNEEIEVQATTYRWIAEKLKKAETTVSGWRRNKILPRADDACRIAYALDTTVEALCDGDAGRKYVARWSAAHLIGFSPPEGIAAEPGATYGANRYKNLIDVAKNLTDTELTMLAGMARVCLESRMAESRPRADVG